MKSHSSEPETFSPKHVGPPSDPLHGASHAGISAAPPAHLAALDFRLPELAPKQLSEFLGYIHRPPPFLSMPGEAMRYFNFVDRWTAYLHDHLSEATSEPWLTAYKHFVQLSNWIPLYFADANLRPLYDRRRAG